MIDRNLDAVVAQKVMGIKVVQSIIQPGVWFYEDNGFPIKLYSSDMNDGWEVAKKVGIKSIPVHETKEKTCAWICNEALKLKEIEN